MVGVAVEETVVGTLVVVVRAFNSVITICATCVFVAFRTHRPFSHLRTKLPSSPQSAVRHVPPARTLVTHPLAVIATRTNNAKMR